MQPLDPDDDVLGVEEQQFLGRYLTTGDLAGAARGTIIESTASTREARSMALKMLQDSTTQEYVVGGMEESRITRKRLFDTLERALDAKNYGLHQASGEKVELGDNTRDQLQAVKLIAQMLNLVGGGIVPKEDNSKPVPVKVIVNYNNGPLDRDDDEDIIDGDSNYSVR